MPVISMETVRPPQGEEIVQQSCKLSAQSVVDTLFKAVQEHAADVETFDDQTS